ncbi:MAG: selenocysteine-specific translation elongation factor, partial [Firmicutes bacterium]|nr:selenocysteine-specific translation elongation factor [Bacillota bacterium]
TDRLKEEKKRGITIENGFADMIHGDYNISIIDVPGHERFVNNMLMGIGGIDMVLLVVGLDEGVMPQTREHFQILTMLEINKGIIVFTKRDMVDDEEWIELVKEDARSMVEGTFLEGAPEIEVSAHENINIEELKQLIVENIDDNALKNDSDQLFRLPVDRVFTISGFGTVVTGTLMEGTINVGDEMMVYPEGKVTKVRNIQVHNEQVQSAYAGQRTAINVGGMKKEELERGSVLARKDGLEPTMMLDIKLKLFDDLDRVVLNGSRVHFYCGSSQVLGKIVLLDRDAAEAGDECYAQMRLEEEVALRMGDRFIIRFYSPLITLGGGKILEVSPRKHKRNDENVLESLKIKDEGTKKEIADIIIKEKSSQLITAAQLAIKMKLSSEEAAAIIDELTEEGRVKIIRKDYLMHEEYLQMVNTFGKKLLDEYHAKNELSAGMIKEEFKSRLEQELRLSDRKIIDDIMANMEGAGVIRIGEKTVAAADFQIRYSPEMEKMRGRILGIYRTARFEMPTVDEVLATEKDTANAKHIIDALENQGELVRLSHQYYIDAQAYNWAFDELKKVVETNGQITLAEFRDIIGTSRKFAMAILDYLDNQKITQKTGDARVLI